MNGPAPVRVLLTGFGPFPEAPVNLSAQLTAEIGEAARSRLPGTPVTTAILPTEWRSAIATLDDLLDGTKPHVCLHYGVSSRARGFTIESRARNARAPRPDAVGELPSDGEVKAGASRQLKAGPHTQALIRHLRDLGLPVSHSQDAGRYLCNAVYFHSLFRAQSEDGRRQVTFIHVPQPSPRRRLLLPYRRPLAADVAVAGGLAILEAAVSAWTRTMA